MNDLSARKGLDNKVVLSVEIKLMTVFRFWSQQSCLNLYFRANILFAVITYLSMFNLKNVLNFQECF